MEVTILGEVITLRKSSSYLRPSFDLGMVIIENTLIYEKGIYVAQIS